MKQKKWNFFYKKEEQTIGEKIINSASMWCVIGLLWWAFCDILTEHYPVSLEIATNMGIGMKPDGVEWQWIIAWLVFLWVGYEWSDKLPQKVVWMFRGLTILVPIGYGLEQKEVIFEGVLAFLEIYLPQVNAYYQLDLQISGGVAESMPVAFTFLTMFLWLVCWLLAYGTRKKVLLLLFPLAALGLELAIGLSPVGNGLVAVFAAGVLLCSAEGRSIASRVLAAGLTVATLVITPVLFEDQIQEYSTEEQKQAVLAWQEEIKNFRLSDVLGMFDIHWDREQLRNEAPNYTGKEILEITASTMPMTSVYLRGYYGTEYKDHTWICDEGSFLEAAKAAGKTGSEAAKEVFEMPHDILQLYADTYSLKLMDEVQYEIEYVGVTGDVAYAPYYSNIESLNTSYDYIGDYLLKKSAGVKKTEVSAFDMPYARYMLYWDDIAEIIERGLYGRSPYWSSYYTRAFSIGEREEELAWYNQQALNYLQVPEDMECISEIVESKLRSEIEENVSWEWTRWAAGDIVMDFQTQNLYRLTAMDKVKEYLAHNVWYSLILDDIPASVDPVEYMLTESHEGYCMHFASAATLLLRELGVPARYVSGYVINRSMFEVEEEGAHATVTDYAAHAWVEVYLDYIGWIPLEATPGYYDSTELPTTKDPQEMEEHAEQFRENMNSQKQEEESESESERESDSDSESESQQMPEENKQPDTSESESQSPSGTGDNGSGTSGVDWLSLLKVAGGVAVAVAGIAAVLWFIRNRILYFDRILEHEIQKKQTRKAIRRMNRRLFGMLFVGIQGVNLYVFRKGRFSDAEYEEALIAHFEKVPSEEWHEYMRIVKKAHYSVEAISIEEMDYCYNCYQTARGMKN